MTVLNAAFVKDDRKRDGEAVLATWSICSRIMREKEELKVIVDEFLGKGGINTASLKCVCENAKTRELAQGGDVEAAERMFYRY